MSNEYPEHYKLRAISDKSQVVGEFLEWLKSGEAHPDGKSIELAYHIGDFLEPHYEGKECLLAKFFEIDLRRLEEEKRQMLEECRKKA